MTKPIPDGYRSVTPSVMYKDTLKAIDFYKKAFGAKMLGIFPSPDGQGVMHATIQIGDSIVMMADEVKGPMRKSAESMGGSPANFWIYTENADTFFNKAVQAGAVSVMPVADMFWGDRMGALQDPFGYIWNVATHTRDMTDSQVKKEAEAFFASMAKK